MRVRGLEFDVRVKGLKLWGGGLVFQILGSGVEDYRSARKESSAAGVCSLGCDLGFRIPNLGFSIHSGRVKGGRERNKRLRALVYLHALITCCLSLQGVEVHPRGMLPGLHFGV